jgi:hypothetical protein
MVDWQVREKAELICARPEGGRANEEQGRTAPILASSCRSLHCMILFILFDGRTSNKELCMLREGFFSIVKIASRNCRRFLLEA